MVEFLCHNFFLELLFFLTESSCLYLRWRWTLCFVYRESRHRELTVYISIDVMYWISCCVCSSLALCTADSKIVSLWWWSATIAGCRALESNRSSVRLRMIWWQDEQIIAVSSISSYNPFLFVCRYMKTAQQNLNLRCILYTFEHHCGDCIFWECYPWRIFLWVVLSWMRIHICAHEVNK